MNRRLGTYITQTVIGEPYKAYVPAPLPPDPSLELETFYPALEKATRALAELKSVTQIIPNTALFVYMYVRKEALLSSQIEGTQSSFSDLILFENHQKPEIALDDVEEVSNYVKAIDYGLTRLKEGFPLSLRLLREIHGILLSGSRGGSKLPGEFRTSQNWIGGTRPGTALFVPPPPKEMMDCLGNFELFLHEETFPVLIQAGLAHLQFETIHPFLDGNGRLGRLLIILLLCNGGLLEAPVLYVSLYLKQHRSVYYQLLQEVREQGDWEKWLVFFLEGVTASATQALETAGKINRLFQEDEAQLETLGRARFSCLETLNYLKKLPQVSVQIVSSALGMTEPTARSALNHLVDLRIVEETSGKGKDKVYVYRKYLDLLEEGTEPLGV